MGGAVLNLNTPDLSGVPPSPVRGQQNTLALHENAQIRPITAGNFDRSGSAPITSDLDGYIDAFCSCSAPRIFPSPLIVQGQIAAQNDNLLHQRLHFTFAHHRQVPLRPLSTMNRNAI